MNIGKVMLYSSMGIIPCYILLYHLGQKLPIWTAYITIFGLLFSIPLIYLEKWSENKVPEEAKTKWLKIIKNILQLRI